MIRKYKKGGEGKSMKILLCMQITALVLSVFLYGCQGKQSVPPVKGVKKQVAATTGGAAALQQEAPADDSSFREGYVYDRRDRRDPFIPLIVPTEKVQKKDMMQHGTLQSYDLGEFSLGAIARMGSRYYALLATPDSRSFTVRKGTVLGLSKGKVQDITKNQVILVEYSKDFKGDMKPRKIILELNKGEAE